MGLYGQLVSFPDVSLGNLQIVMCHAKNLEETAYTLGESTVFLLEKL